MSRNTISIFILVLTGILALWMPINDVLAQSSLGIGRGEQALPTGGWFSEYFAWIREQQTAFSKQINDTVVGLKKDGTLIGTLAGISFLYGVFHAVGPGHGKVVISSYMLANEVALRRGVILSLASAFLQGITAILAISFFMLALRGSGIKTGDLQYGLEIASYIGVMGVGLWLIWRKLSSRKKAHSHSHNHNHNHNHDHVGHGDVCNHCGHSHAPDPKMLDGKFGLREAWSAIIAVGLRPCTGALIVLIFCFSNGLYLAGILSTLAMSFGTAIAVSGLATLAVLAKNSALKVAGMQGQLSVVNSIIEITGAVLIFLIGFVLFYAAIQA